MKKLITLMMTLGLILISPFVVKADILQELQKQPAKVQSTLGRNNVSIEIIPIMDIQTSLTDTFAYTQVTTLEDTRTIVSCKIRILSGHENCLTHEVGHAISNYNNYRWFWSDNPTWDAIYATESQKQILYPQGWYDKQEYFACCYDEYLNHPEYMRVVQPNSYNYIKVVLSYL